MGWLFTILGAILIVYGCWQPDAVTSLHRTVGVNVNFRCGCGMLIFGLGSLYWARHKRRADKNLAGISHEVPLERDKGK